MPMSHQGRVRAPPAQSPAHSTGHATTPSRDAPPQGGNGGGGGGGSSSSGAPSAAEERCRDLELRLLASEAERRNLDGQKTRLEAALEECMDLLLQVSNDEGGGGKQAAAAQAQAQQAQAVSEAVAAAEERLHREFDEAVQRERAAFAAEREGLRAQVGELRTGYEDAVADLRRCVQREEDSRRDRDALDAAAAALRAQLREAHDAAAEARAASAGAAEAALADERKRREEETQARQTAEGQLRALAQAQQRVESDLVADAQRIRTQLHERRSQGGGSEKWSLSPDNSPAATAAAASWAKASCVGVPALPGAAANGGGGGGSAVVAGLVGLGATPPRGMSPPQSSARGGGGGRSTALSSPAPSAGRPSAFGSLPGTPAGTASVATPGTSTAAVGAAAAAAAATPAQLSVTVPVLRPIQYYHATTTTTPHNASVDVI